MRKLQNDRGLFNLKQFNLFYLYTSALSKFTLYICIENKFLDAITRAEPLYVSLNSHSRLVRKRIKGTRCVAARWSRGVVALDKVTRVQGCIERCIMWRGDVYTYLHNVLSTCGHTNSTVKILLIATTCCLFLLRFRTLTLSFTKMATIIFFNIIVLLQAHSEKL